MSAKRERTRQHLGECALDLFEAQGFEATSVAQIANAAGVTEMTFFRHFGSKEQAVLTDPFDPVIAEAVGARPAGEAPLDRAVRGLRSAFAALSAADLETARRRIRIVASTPALRGAAAVQNETTALAISDALAADGTDPLAARVAAAAVLAAVTTALYAWAADQDANLPDLFDTALDTLESGHG
ncbi:TetR/AcrR family transcriptional regulator [Glycomyces harbinensis]|uniref:Transcriptional regulator, TetR family n=1 Tax=Glycomyces harbinensis TaxID=58114 RepID=A0A1G6XNX7_9ACTN|nr:TetR/AcrR family transcriptional regulator [Glycomyces harbinensis]SDD79919.1 transcriptional regulator, TetR family [Glycomyces harbinensis]